MINSLLENSPQLAAENFNGVIVADKPRGWTSHDVVAAVKKKIGARKVGHLGTLDPLATGVLPLVIDGATKASRLLEGGRKDYIAALKLGEATDTYDSEGKVLSTGDFSRVIPGDILRALSGFTGKIRQVPPMYSSIKRAGVPLYRLARRGIVVEREARDVEVFGIEALNIASPYLEFRVVCSRGTYVRSICSDLGNILGCGAHLTGLRRVASGAFTIGESVSPEAGKETLISSIIPIEEAIKRSSAQALCPTGEDTPGIETMDGGAGQAAKSGCG
ncbi:MAG: tRNA pseudouridine(55) synthase TruB [Deltaproteobacteria bacterium]|nr:tRNA pseudouridine(55) synthase TruB [Deltaproteobacteria bacterium]